MKVLLRIVIISCLLCISITNLNAQSIFIQNMTIVPSYPTNQDSVLLIVEATFTSGPCNQVVLYPTIIGNFISIQAGHNLGPLAYICTSVDTIQLGLLPPGTYNLQYNITAGGSQVSDSLMFIVSATPGIPEEDLFDVSYYFNPSTDQIFIESKSNKIESVQLYDINSRLIKNFISLDNGNRIQLDANDLPNGHYLICMRIENRWVSRKIIIHH